MQEFPQSIAKEQATTERRMVSWDLVDAFSEVVKSGKTLQELAAAMVHFPQVLVNVKNVAKEKLAKGSSSIG